MAISKAIQWKRIDTFILIGVFLWLNLMLLIPPFESIFYREDMSAYTAREYATRAAIKDGELPLWNPFTSEPLLANPQGLTLYPISMVIRWLPMQVYVVLFASLHTTLLFAALYIFLRHWEFSRLASLGAAGIVAFSSYVFVRHIAGHLGVTPVRAWSIFCLLFYARLLQYHRFRDFIGVLICATMLILSAHTIHALIGLLLVGSYSLFYLAGNPNKKSLFQLLRSHLNIPIR